MPVRTKPTSAVPYPIPLERLTKRRCHWATSHDHRPPVRDTRPSSTALYWKMKMKMKMQLV